MFQSHRILQINLNLFLLSRRAFSFDGSFAFDCHFIQNPARAADFLRDEQHVANINGNRAISFVAVKKIVRQTFKVAVENDADLFAETV